MERCLIDVSGDVNIPYGTGTSALSIENCYLPPGTATCSRLYLGRINRTDSSAILQLDGTRFGVSTSADIGHRGTLTANVSGFSCGPDLASAATLSATAPGKLQINFLVDQDPGDPEATYWGLRWAGKHLAELGVLKTAGTLAWNDAAVAPKTAGIWYVPGENATYVTIKEVWPPIAIPRNLNLERLPPTWPDVEITVGDIDSGSYDPGGGTITNRVIQSADDETPGQPYITFSSNGTYTVTLTVWNDSGVSGSDNCTVVVGDIQAGTLSAVTWDAGAALELMPRQEWFWGNNWVGDAPPANPTAATVFFSDTGLNTTSRLDTDRAIGALTVNNTSGGHLCDLGGNRLTVTNGNLMVNPPNPGLTARMTFTNGTLQLGSSGQRRDLTIGSGGGGYLTGMLTISTGAVFDAYINTLTIGGSEGGRGTLDLRGADVGELRATTIQTGTGGSGNYGDRRNRILMDDGTVISNIVARYLDLGLSQANRFRIGRPTGDQDSQHLLPDNVDITVGAPDARGRIRMATDAWATVDSRVEANAGGEFVAYLDYMTLGGVSFGGTSTAILDIKKMDRALLDCTGKLTMYGNAVASGYYGTFKLPAGTASFNEVEMGAVNAGNYSRLELNGTELTVAASLTVRTNGTLTVNVGDASSGIVLAEATALTVDTSGKIQLNFTEAPVDRSQGHYGLRWGGDDKEDELQALKDAGTLDWDDAAVNGKVGIYIHLGATYVGIPPPRGTLMMLR